MTTNLPQDISTPTLLRLPSYLDVIHRAKNAGKTRLSSAEIGKELGYGSVQVRKDLASVSDAGKPRTGFDIYKLEDDIRDTLGFNEEKNAVLLGVGHLGRALMNYEGFRENGLHILAGFDVKPTHDSTLKDKVLTLNELEVFVAENVIDLAIICTPASEADRAAETIVNAGIKAIWNFAPTTLHVPDEIVVQNENIAESLGVLWYNMINKKHD
jgi:redox-sensing transcriptional repressor